MKALVLAALIAVCLSAGSAVAQEPVEPIDIKADSVSYRFLSPSLMEITVTFTVQESGGGGGGGGGYIESFFDVFCQVDGTPHRVPLNFTVSDNDCGIDPECDNPCEITVSSGEIIWNYCNTWHTWTGAGCDPNDPGGTCIPLDICACGAQFEIETEVPYSGETGPIVVVADPTNLVLEADETNNVCMAPLEPAEPIEPIDLKADSVLYHFPATGVIEVAAYFTVHSSHNEVHGYSSELALKLGENTAYSAPISIMVPYNDCGNDPDCNDACEVYVSEGSLIWDYCSIWHTWGGAMCNPSNPGETCFPIEYCACGSQYVLVTTLPYDGEQGLVFTIDGVELVPEADETNNSYSVLLAPVSTESESWGVIKSLFGK